MSNRQSRALEVYASVGGAAFLEALVAEWKRHGWQVTSHHALTEEAYRAASTRLRRWLVRWRMYGQFAWQCWEATRRSREAGPLRVVTTNPFFAPALVQRNAKGSGATINLLYDLYPDALVQAGVLPPDSWMARRCASLTRMALRECTATVFLGERLRQHAESSYGAARLSAVIPVGADGGPFRDCRPQPTDALTPIRILYAGQMGRMHEVETVSRALASGIPRGVEIFFHASGAGYARLRREAQDTQGCMWRGPLDPDAWQRTMIEAQVALVTMAPGAENIIMPSKTYSALVAGQAILAVCPEQSDLADVVREHACGWVVEPGDVAGLRRCWAEIAADRAALQEKRRRAYEAGHRLFDSRIVARQWELLFQQLLPPQASPSFPTSNVSDSAR